MMPPDLIRQRSKEVSSSNSFNNKKEDPSPSPPKVEENEYITDDLGVENTYSFDKIDEFGDVYEFMHNAKDNNELIDYFYKVMIDNYQISPRLTYIKNWTKDNIVELNSWNWWIYYLLGISLFVFFTMIFVSPPADALVALLGIDTSYSGIFEWVLLFMYLGLPIYISQKNKE